MNYQSVHDELKKHYHGESLKLFERAYVFAEAARSPIIWAITSEWT